MVCLLFTKNIRIVRFGCLLNIIFQFIFVVLPYHKQMFCLIYLFNLIILIYYNLAFIRLSPKIHQCLEGLEDWQSQITSHSQIYVDSQVHWLVKHVVILICRFVNVLPLFGFFTFIYFLLPFRFLLSLRFLFSMSLFTPNNLRLNVSISSRELVNFKMLLSPIYHWFS